MPATKQTETPDSANELLDTIQDVEKSSLEAVRRFLDTVNDAFPDLTDSGEDGPRRKIIDSAFKMSEQLVGAANDLARNIVRVSGDALEKSENERASSKN